MVIDCAFESIESPDDDGTQQLLHSKTDVAASPTNGRECTLLIPSNACLSVWLDGLSGNRNRSATEFHLEEVLPVDVEEIESQFIDSVGGCLAITIRRNIVEEVIRQLETDGYRIHWIVPRALLLAQAIAIYSPITVDHYLLVIGNQVAASQSLGMSHHQDKVQKYFDVIELQSGRPLCWQVLAPEIFIEGINSLADLPKNDDSQFSIGQTSINSPDKVAISTTQKEGRSGTACPTIMLVDVLSEYSERLEMHLGEQARFVYFDATEIVAKLETEIRRGTKLPWVNFRSGRLAAPRPPRKIDRWIRAAQAVTILALAMLSSVFFASAWLDDQTTIREETTQSEIYRNLFAQRRIPRSVRRALESELVSLHRPISDQSTIKLQSNAAWIWIYTMRALPENRSSRIQAMQFANNRVVSLDGVTGTIEDLNSFMESMKKEGFVFQLPNFQKLGEGVKIEIRDATLSEQHLGDLARFVEEEAK